MAEPAPASMDLTRCSFSICTRTAAELQAPLDRCGRCRITTYCSRECQTADWPLHKGVCNRPAAPNSTPVQQNSTNNHQNDLHSTWDARSWLSNLPEKECYEAISDACRLRMDDEKTPIGASEFVLLVFMGFLGKARVAGILPDTCIARDVIDMATNETGNACIYRAMEVENVPERYRDPDILEKLRMLAATVYGTPVESQ